MSRGEPPLLVELAVVGQVSLCHNAQQRTALYDSSTVVEQRADLHGQSDDSNHVELAGEVEQLHQSLLSLVDKQLLVEEILTGIARQTEFWEHHHLDALPFGLGNQTFHLSHIIVYIGHLDNGDGGGHFQESVFHSFTN